jgi:hypothetical protein
MLRFAGGGPRRRPCSLPFTAVPEALKHSTWPPSMKPGTRFDRGTQYDGIDSQRLPRALQTGSQPQHFLLRAVEAVVVGRRLTLFDIARSWPGAERIRAPLKALDRLLSNPHMHAQREQIYAGMARWLIRSKQPVIAIDWSDLKADRSWHLLRAAIPVGGRTMPILDWVFPAGQQGSPKARRLFLERLGHILPPDACPVLVTDAGFCGPWFRAVEAKGWHWLGRLRHRTHVKPVDAEDRDDQWLPCKAVYELADAHPRDLGLMHAIRNHPVTCRMVLHAKPPRGRKHRNRRDVPVRSSQSRQQARRESSPWLLMASPEQSTLSARRIATRGVRDARGQSHLPVSS